MLSDEPLRQLIQDGHNINNEAFAVRWLQRADAFVTVVLDGEDLELFHNLTSQGDPFDRLSCAVGFLEGLVHGNEEDKTTSNPSRRTEDATNSTTVFIVHGHDSAAKEQAARFIERIGLNAIILHERPNAGATIIEKFEHFSEVSFAVVILTDDDLGCCKSDQGNLQPRARQNVIFELGYFIAKLGRRRVCALYSNNVELPSDISGVAYLQLDDAGAWKLKLAQEFVGAGMPIDISKIIGST
jgi:predicted nucleotide-binding protein